MSLAQFINLIKYIIQNPYFQKIFFATKLFFIALFFILLGAVIFFLLKTNFLRYLILEDLVEFLSFKPYGISKIRKKWNKINDRLKFFNQSDYKVSVIEANQLLNKLLEEKGYSGKDTKDRLENVGPQLISSFNDFLEAYEVYKCISEDPSYKLSRTRAREVLRIYENVMKDLGFLQ